MSARIKDEPWCKMPPLLCCRFKIRLCGCCLVLPVHRFRKRRDDVDEEQSLIFYRNLIDQIIKNVSKDRPQEAVVRLWTSAIKLHTGQGNYVPGFYSIWNEALRIDDQTVMSHVVSLSRLLNTYCCELRRSCEASSAAVPASLPAVTIWPADRKLHRGGSLGPAAVSSVNLAWYQSMQNKWYRCPQYLATSMLQAKAEQFMIRYGGANKVQCFFGAWSYCIFILL